MRLLLALLLTSLAGLVVVLHRGSLVEARAAGVDAPAGPPAPTPGPPLALAPRPDGAGPVQRARERDPRGDLGPLTLALLEADGSPAAGVILALVEGERVASSAETSEVGLAALARAGGATRLFAVAPHFRVHELDLADALAGRPLRLPAASEVRGQVTFGGRGADLLVSVSLHDVEPPSLSLLPADIARLARERGSCARLERHALAHEDGGFAFEGLPATWRGSVRARDFWRRELEVDLSGPSCEVRLDFPHSASVRGVVLAEDGRPFSGTVDWEVWDLWEEEWTATGSLRSGEDGRFETPPLDPAVGRYGCFRLSTGAGGGMTLKVELELDPIQGADVGQMQLQSPTHIELRVVQALGSGPPGSETWPDLELSVESLGWGLLESDAGEPLVLSGDAPLPQPGDPHRGLTGLLDVYDEGAAGFLRVQSRYTRMTGLRPDRPIALILTDDVGAFRLSFTPVRPRRGQVTELLAPLPCDPWTVHGTVVGPDGSPSSSARVRARDAHPDVRGVRTKRDGTFQAICVAPVVDLVVTDDEREVEVKAIRAEHMPLLIQVP